VSNRRYDFEEFDRAVGKTMRGFKAWFAFVAVLGLGLGAFLIWALYTLIEWVVTK
jgi:hypothetical protein